MAVNTVARFRTYPGRLADHLAAAEEAVGHLRRLGLPAVNLQPIAGADVGSMATMVGYEDNAAYAAGMQSIMADDGWQEFWGRVTSDPPAEQVEATIYADLDPSFQPDPDRPLGVIQATQWRPLPGRLNDFIANVVDSSAHIDRMGAQARAMQSLVGQYPLTVIVGIGHADMAAYGEFADTVAADGEWQEFWAGVMADPTADLVRSGIYLNIS